MPKEVINLRKSTINLVISIQLLLFHDIIFILHWVDFEIPDSGWISKTHENGLLKQSNQSDFKAVLPLNYTLRL